MFMLFAFLTVLGVLNSILCCDSGVVKLVEGRLSSSGVAADLDVNFKVSIVNSLLSVDSSVITISN